MKRIVVILLMVFISLNVFAQELVDAYIIDHQPEYMLPSQESISRIKSVARPTGVATGIPQIAIPLWNNQMCKYAINLSYYAGGIQVSELASSVGLGWNLEVGGVIARVVQGLPDDLPEKGYLSFTPELKTVYDLSFDSLEVAYNNSFSSYEGIEDTTLNDIGNLYDPSSDVYYYNFHGIKGKFIFNKNGSIISIPYNNLRIIPSFNISGNIEGFMIKTPDGTNYIFSEIEEVTINSCSADLGFTSYNSAWYLSGGNKMYNADVFYEYETVYNTIDRKLYDFKYYDESGNIVGGTATANLTISRPQLKSISDVNSIVQFNFDQDNRLNSAHILGVYPDVEPADTTAITDIIFEYGNFSSPSDNLLRERQLLSVKIGKEVNGVQRIYNFEYNNGNDTLSSEDSKEQDLWGYYNANGESSLISNLYYDSVNDYYECISNTYNLNEADRNVSSNSIQEGILTKITNPEGGITKYEYEPHSFNYNDSTILGGGLRIKKIRYYSSSDRSEPENTITYSYDIDGTTSGVLLSKPNFAYNLRYHPNYSNYDTLTFSYSNYTYGLHLPFGNPLFYSQVRIDNGLGYTIKKYELPIDTSQFSNINQYIQTSLSLQNTAGDHQVDIFYKGANYLTNYSYGLNSIYLTEESLYDSNASIISKTQYNYMPVEDQDINVEFGYFASPKTIYNTKHVDKDIRTLKKYYYPTVWKLLEQKVEKNYSSNTEQTYITNYEYPEIHPIKVLKKIETFDIDGNKHFKKFIYPFDYYYDSELLEPIELAIGDHTQQLSDLIQDNTDIYKHYLNSELYILRKKADLSSLKDEPEEIADADSAVVALATMLNQGNFTTPVEIIEGIEFEDTIEITSASLTKFKKIENEQIVPYKDYLIQGPIAYDETQISEIIADTLRINPSYQLTRKYTKYNFNGELIQMVDASGITTTFQWYTFGNYLKSKTINATHTVSYEYRPLIGKTKETDFSGNSIYYIYDTNGKLLATKDDDKNIRTIYDYNIVNSAGEQKVDKNTDADDTFKYSAIPEATLSFNSNFETFYINEFNPVFEYEVDFGDDSVETVNSSSFNHSYTYGGNYTVVLREKKEGITLNEHEITVDISGEIQP